MLPDDTRKRIENITAGIVIEGLPDTCTTIRNLFSASFATSTTVKTDFESKSVIKKEQVQLLEKYSTENNLWVTDLPGEDNFLTRGGEARVYLDKGGLSDDDDIADILKSPVTEVNASGYWV